MSVTETNILVPHLLRCLLNYFWTKSRLLPVFTCIFALSATYFGIFARRAFVRCPTPMIVCLSNARSGDLHFDTSFVALHTLVREIITNTIHTYIHTYIHTWPKSDFLRLFDSASRLRRSASVWTSKCMDGMNQTEAEYPRHSKRSQTASLIQIGLSSIGDITIYLLRMRRIGHVTYAIKL